MAGWIVTALILIGSGWLFLEGARNLKDLLADHARGDGGYHPDSRREARVGLSQAVVGAAVFLIVGYYTVSLLLSALLSLAVFAIFAWALL